jgi:glutaredoxin
MKKIIFLFAMLAIYQNWYRIEPLFNDEQTTSATQSYTKNQVILYSTSWCGYCKKTRELLAKQNIAFTEYDIEKSEEGRRQHAALGGKGVPVIKVGDAVIFGYDKDGLLAAIYENRIN